MPANRPLSKSCASLYTMYKCIIHIIILLLDTYKLCVKISLASRVKCIYFLIKNTDKDAESVVNFYIIGNQRQLYHYNDTENESQLCE